MFINNTKLLKFEIPNYIFLNSYEDIFSSNMINWKVFFLSRTKLHNYNTQNNHNVTIKYNACKDFLIKIFKSK
uniref:Putative secreted protein n=1 Tax=Xenopsylla cheopis TaxID=163159 RepID=A0A6M2DFH6_XENCH